VVTEKYNEVKSALSHCSLKRKSQEEEEGSRASPMNVYPKHCSRYCTCFCKCFSNKINGNEFYGDEILKLEDEVAKEKMAALNNPIGIVFITFKSYEMSREFCDAFKRSIFTFCKARPPTHNISNILKPQNWKVSYAPVPEDIYWQNLGSSNYWWMKYLSVNSAVLTFILLFSTPGNDAQSVKFFE